MGGYDRRSTLVICSCQLLASKFHISFNLRNKITNENCNPPDFYLPTWKIFAPHCTSPNLTQNHLSDRLWVPLLYMFVFTLCSPKLRDLSIFLPLVG